MSAKAPKGKKATKAAKAATAPNVDMRAAGEVSVDVRDAVATIRFSHPKSNSLPLALLRRLAASIRELAVSSARVVVLSSGGEGAFCAGASFEELKAVKDAASGREFFSGFGEVILAMIRAPQVVVTRVHGKVTGGGVGLVAASDYAFGTSGASLKLSELALGLGPFVIGPAVERRVGPGPFAAMSIDADWRDAEWAERHGLYARVFDDVAAMDAAIERLTGVLAKSNPDAIRRLKQVFWQGTENWDDLMNERAAASGELSLSQFTRDAIAKFERK